MNGCPCEIFKVFWTENDSTWGGLEPPTFEIMPNALTIWDIRPRHLLSHVFEYWQYTLTIYVIHNIDDKSCHRDEVFNQQQYQVIWRPHEFNGGVFIYPCPNLSTIYTTVQSKLEKYPFWILIDEIMFLYLVHPCELPTCSSYYVSFVYHFIYTDKNNCRTTLIEELFLQYRRLVHFDIQMATNGGQLLHMYCRRLWCSIRNE